MKCRLLFALLVVSVFTLTLSASARDVVLGRTPAYHDLSALARTLRSHGGRYEEMVPLVFSKPLNASYAARAAADI